MQYSVFPHAPWLSEHIHVHCNTTCFRSRPRGQLNLDKMQSRRSSVECFYEKSNTYNTRYQTSLPQTWSKPLPSHFRDKKGTTSLELSLQSIRVARSTAPGRSHVLIHRLSGDEPWMIYDTWWNNIQKWKRSNLTSWTLEVVFLVASSLL
jgi:hypothetical protein